jgi:peptidoglycan/xylan/chitin deacetylase (PgdA/CDA1 family)
MSLNEFRAALAAGKAFLEDLAGSAVVSYRAPEWSLRGSAEGWWRELPGLGFRIDSSRAPLKILGDPAWPREARRMEKDLWELPPPVAGAGPLTVPLWGWALRLLPGAWLRQRILALAEAGSGTPLVLHPWELDEGQPPLPPGTPLGHRFAHAAGLRGHRARLRTLWGGLRLVSLEAWVDARETGA